MTIIIRLEYDQSTESPATYDGWTPYSFNRRDANYRDPGPLGVVMGDDPSIAYVKMAEKLRDGLAFFLSYYEHGDCVWSLMDEGPQCRWDSTRVAGIIVWEHPDGDIGAETVEDRRKDAAAFLKTFTDWCNGENYYYSATKVRDCPSCAQEEEVDDVGGCGGFIGAESLFAGIREDLGTGPFTFRGEAAGLAAYWKED